MTDVRLTALNPTDSQVYPVACNTSGELLVADDGTDYLPLTGGELTGPLTSTSSITATGFGSSANNPVLFDVNGTERLRILSDGTIATGGLTSTPATVAPGSFIQFAANAGFFVNGYDGKFGTSSNHPIIFQVNGSQKARIDTNGTVTFSSNIELTDSTVDLYSQTSSSSSKTFQLFSDVGGTKTERVVITASGAASFAGDITCTDDSTGLVLKSPNGTFFRISVANDGSLSTSAI